MSNVIIEANEILNTLAFEPVSIDKEVRAIKLFAVQTRGRNTIDKVLVLLTGTGTGSHVNTIIIDSEVYGGEEDTSNMVVIANNKHLGAIARFITRSYPSVKAGEEQLMKDAKTIVQGHIASMLRLKPASKTELLKKALQKERSEKEEMAAMLELQQAQISNLMAKMEMLMANQ